MLTNDRVPQFFALLEQILSFCKDGRTVQDAGISAFREVSKNFNIKEPTIRDMVTRCCKNKLTGQHNSIDEFYTCIEALFTGNTMPIQIYYDNIDKTLHKRLTMICQSYHNSGITLPQTSPKEMKKTRSSTCCETKEMYRFQA
jgi:hypothetical protein